jgi:transcriptional repressor NrdR
MLCPSCKKSDTKVLDSRDLIDHVKRRRECLKCKFRFTTFERLELSTIKIIKRDGSCVKYDREKLSRGINLALEKRPFKCEQAEKIVNEIEGMILSQKDGTITSRAIGEMVIEKLRKIDQVAYLRFLSVFKKFGSAKKFQKEAEKLS